MNQLSIVTILLLGLSVVFAQSKPGGIPLWNFVSSLISFNFSAGIAQIRGTDLDEGVTGTVKFTQINVSLEALFR